MADNRAKMAQDGEDGTGHFTEQEEAVARHLMSGLDISEAATKMGIHRQTIGSYMHNMRLKKGARTTYQLMAMLGKEEMEGTWTRN